jgi:aspartyl-tRNA(Asn)/glutamyl-tRNA(Gln) amidotransferase subunit A
VRGVAGVRERRFGVSPSVPQESDPADLGVLAAAELLRARRLSAGELAEACLRRIDERNGGPPSYAGSPDAINAWARLYPEVARRDARAADERLALEGERAPLLCGVPIALKDLFAVAGLPITASSRVLEGSVADADAVAWARLRDAGMVLVGHTHTHEFAAGGTTDQVGNPWSLDRIVGGSSGGSAAALAARMVSAATGTDTCGSLRIPAACCGTSALKASHGRVPIGGIIPLAPSLDHAGPMARSIADCGALLAAMAAGGPAATPLLPPPAEIGPLALAARPGPLPLAGVRIAITDRTDDADVDQPVAAVFDTATSACESLGATIVRLPAPWTFEWDDLSAVLMTEAWAYHADHAGSHDRYRPALAEFVETARSYTDARAYLGAQTRRSEGTERWEEWFRVQRIDLVLEPTLPIVPWERGSGYERGHAGGPGDPLIALTALWNMTGMPVAALPVTWQAGVSLIAPRGREASLVQVAIDLQEHALGVPAAAAEDG